MADIAKSTRFDPIRKSGPIDSSAGRARVRAIAPAEGNHPGWPKNAPSAALQRL